MSDAPERNEIDLDASKKFWETRAGNATDPRSVTLDRQPPWLMRFEVGLYQGWMLRRIPKRRPLNQIVDLGCGNGDWTVVFAKLADRVWAADFSEGMIAATRARLDAAGLLSKATLVRGDVAELELPESELVVAGAVVQYLSDAKVEQLLGNIHQALSADGCFYLRTTITKSGVTDVKKGEGIQGIYRSIDWYEESLDRAGFEVVARSTATRFVADEISRRLMGPVWALAYYPLLGVRRIIRSRKPTDVAVFIVRPKVLRALAESASRD